MRSTRLRTTAILLGASLAVAGCGGDDDDPIGGSGDLTLIHPATVPLVPLVPADPSEPPLTPLTNPDYEYEEPASVPPGVDALSLRFHDAQDKLVHEPIRVAASDRIELQGVPVTARYIDID